MKIKNISFRFQLLIVFILMFFLTYLFPYSGDDWAWGSSIGLNRLYNGFANYNGRYLGNIIVLLLTRSNILKSIVMSITIVCIAYGIMCFINKENKKIFWISLLLIFLIPTNILAQGIVWTSGFTNYAIPVLLIVVYLNIFKNIFTDSEDYEINGKLSFITLLLGFSNALFMENITIYNSFISLILFIYTYIKFKKFDYVQFSFFVGSIFGLVLMFSNGAYYNIANNNDGYRQIAQNSNILIRCFDLYFSKFYHLFSFDNYALNVFLSTVILFFTRILIKIEKSKVTEIALYLCMSYYISYICYIFIRIINPNWNIMLKYTRYFEGGLVIIFCIVTLIVTLIGLNSFTQMKKAFFLETSIIVLVAPLFFVNPIGPRCFLPSYILFVALVCCFIDEIQLPQVSMPLILSVGICYLYLLNVYSVIYKNVLDRNIMIQNNVMISKKIYIDELPYKNYVWTGDPKIKIWNDRFKLFYDIPEDCEIIVKSTK